jgi:erythromycin esterase
MAGGSDPHGVVGTGQVDSPDEGAGPDDVARWIDAHARPLVTYDPDAPLDDLTPLGDLADQATVVALGGSTRGAHELAALTQRAVRFLVGELGFRTLALEMGAAQSGALDRYVRTGDGRPRELLSRPGIRSFWRVEEVLGTVRWLRSYAEAHPDDPVRFTGVDSDDPLPVAGPGPRPSDGGLELDRIEQALAENTVRWHERTGHKVAYWGGAAHMARGHARSVSAPPGRPAVGRNAGSYLHEHFGSGYVPIGLTFPSRSRPVRGARTGPRAGRRRARERRPGRVPARPEKPQRAGAAGRAGLARRPGPRPAHRSPLRPRRRPLLRDVRRLPGGWVRRHRPRPAGNADSTVVLTTYRAVCLSGSSNVRPLRVTSTRSSRFGKHAESNGATRP